MKQNPFIFFVDEVNFSSILRIVLLGGRYSLVWYFEKISPYGQKIIKFINVLRIFRGEFRQVNHQISQAKTSTGERAYSKALLNAREICSKIREHHFQNNPFLIALQRLWDREHTAYYLEQQVEQFIRLECVRIALIVWLQKGPLPIDPENRVILLIKKSPWISYLKEYALSEGLDVKGYQYIRKVKLSKKFISILSGMFKRLFSYKKIKPVNYNEVIQQKRKTFIGLKYWYRKLSFNKGERSEFFWLDGLNIPHSDIIIYNFSTDQPLKPEIFEEINSHKIGLYGAGPGIPSWTPTPAILKPFLHAEKELIAALMSCLIRGKPVSLYFLGRFHKLAFRYAYWYDFFLKNEIRLILGTSNLQLAEILAIKSLGGVSLSYQYSISNINVPSTLLSGGDDVRFVFSPLFEDLSRKLNEPVGYYVHTGFIYDVDPDGFKDNGSILSIRKQLEKAGARFVICYFDENSGDRWDVPNSNEDISFEYESLLNWLLSDPKLGIVFKPKNSLTLFSRIARLAPLISIAKQTGRCVFFTSEYLLGDIYPAEVAMIADLCIGSIIGGTVALEAALAGKLSILIDNSNYLNHWFYRWGKNNIVFDSWETLRENIERHRSDPNALPQFGNWTAFIKDLHPFVNGRSSVRMGHFIESLYSSFNKGLTKQKALEIACQAYATAWGSERVSRGPVFN